MKNFITGLTIVAVIGAALFWRDVWEIFAGMTALEALTQIVTFILHVAVATIAVYAVTTLPELVKPWMRAFRWKQRQARRGQVSSSPTGGRMPRINKDAMLLAFIEREMAKSKNSRGGEGRQ